MIIIGVGVLKGINNYFHYLIIALLILFGIKAVVDFLFGFPMYVGVSHILYPTDENKVGRIFLLLIAISSVIFGFWWIFSKPI